MREVKLYDIGEEVFVKAKVTGIKVEDGEIKYNLKNDITGRSYEYLFTSSQITPVEKITTPLMKGTSNNDIKRR